MTRQLEQLREENQEKADRRLVSAVEHGLVRSLDRAGMRLTGLSARIDDYEVLITFRGDSAEGPKVCFVGAETLADALRKAVREAESGKLKLREDKYRT